MKQPPPRLKVGGTLGLQDLYVRRAEDAEVLELLRRREFCNILTSRQMGKSSLMVRLMTQLASECSARIATVDMAGDLGTPDTAESWYIGFLDKIALDLAIDCDVEVWWRDEGRGTPNTRLLQFFRDVVGKDGDAPIYVFVDEVDATLKLDYADDFFTAIRSIYNQRSTVDAYRRLTFCLVGVASPTELIREKRTTPYNIGHTIELRDFDAKQDDLSPLYEVMSADGAPGKDIVHAVLDKTGGQPFLTVALCARALAEGAQTASDVDKVVEEVLSATNQNAIKTHLETINTFLATRLADEAKTLRLYSSILKGRTVRDRITTAHLGLRLSGLVKRDAEGCLVVRNPFYLRRFGPSWLRQTRPMRTQARLVRVAVASVVLALVATGLAIYLARNNAYDSTAIDALKATTDPTAAMAQLASICEAVQKGSPITDEQVATARAHVRKLWDDRATRLEDDAKREPNLHTGRALLLGALAGVARGQLPLWFYDEYAKSNAPYLIATLHGGDKEVLALRFLTVDQIVSVAADDSIRVFDVGKGRQVAPAITVVGLTPALDICADGTCFCTAATPFGGSIWSNKLERRREITIANPEYAYAMATDPSKPPWQRIAIAEDSGLIRVGSLVPKPRPPNATTDTAELVIDTQLARKSRDAKTGQMVQWPVFHVQFSPNGQKLVAAAMDSARVYDLGTKQEAIFEMASQPLDARFSSGGDRIVVTAKHEVRVYDVFHGTTLGEFVGASLFSHGTFFGDGEVLSAATRDGKGLVVVWRIQDNRISFIQPTDSNIVDAEPAPGKNPKILATGHSDGTIRVWRVEEDKRTLGLRDLFSSLQQKFGLTASDDGKIEPIGDAGPRTATGYAPNACGW